MPSDLRSERIGNTVRLLWTTPADTTDNLPIRGPIRAELCRVSSPVPVSHGPAPANPSAAAAASPAPACSWSRSLPVAPGPSAADDPLSDPALTADPPGLLLYTVRIRNSSGRAAASSPPALAASGSAPPPIADLRATPRRDGAQLTWKIVPGSDAAVELHRTEPAAPAGEATRPARPGRPRQPSSTATHLRANPPGHPDPGGTLDLSAPSGSTLLYRAERVRTVTLAGNILTLHSEPAAPILVTLTDIFPPATPAGLVAVAASTPSSEPAIDLSWEAAADPDLAGYIVERSDAASGNPSPGPWHRLNPALLTAPAFHDTAVEHGPQYQYRVSAVDRRGNRSPPGASASITLSPALRPLP